MIYTGKSKDSKEIQYIQYVMQLSGATMRQFVRAAVLYYCDYLMKRANEMREEEIAKIKARQTEREANESITVNGDIKEQEQLEDTDSSALPDKESAVADS